VKVLVVDDEDLARQRLLRLLGKLPLQLEVAEAASGESALARVAESVPDLALLDIRMPGMDGIEVARRLAELPEPPAVLFCTAYDEYALSALQHQAVGYLLKPVREADLANAIERAGRVNRAQLVNLAESATEHSGRSTITSNSHMGVESIDVAEVRCFIADQKYVSAHTPQREFLVRETLKELEQEFAERFVRIHRNALVALEHIEALRRVDPGWIVVLKGSALTPAVSRRHLRDLRERMNRH